MLRKYSSIFVGVSLVVPILGIVGGLITAIQLESFLIFLYFALPSVLFYLFSKSYAHLLNTAANNEDALAEIAASLKGSNAQQNRAEMLQETSVATAPETSDEVPLPSSTTPIIDPENPQIITCPQCQLRQSADRKTCFRCGIKFER